MIDGLRIDHPDGLYDPAATSHGCRRSMRSAPACAVDAAARPLYVVAEKISRLTNTCRRRGAVHGTPATASPTWSTACSSTAAHGRASTASGARSSATRPTTSRRLRTKPGARCCAARSPPDSPCSPTALGAWRAATAARATTRSPRLRHGLAEIAACFPVYRTYVSRDGVGRAGPALHRLGGRARAAAAAASPTPACSTSCATLLLAEPRECRHRRSSTMRCTSPCASSSSPRRLPPRASRTPPSTATTGWSR